jgi:hemerythrin
MTAYLEWQDGYRVGVAQFDEEHKALLDRINRIVTANIGRHEMYWVSKLLGTLVDDILHQFDHEEIVMESTYYPDRDAHRGSHDRLLRNLMRHIEKCRLGDISSTEFGTYLYDWLLEHIVQEDMKLGAYLRERGMQ